MMQLQVTSRPYMTPRSRVGRRAGVFALQKRLWKMVRMPYGVLQYAGSGQTPDLFHIFQIIMLFSGIFGAVTASSSSPDLPRALPFFLASAGLNFVDMILSLGAPAAASFLPRPVNDRHARRNGRFRVSATVSFFLAWLAAFTATALWLTGMYTVYVNLL